MTILYVNFILANFVILANTVFLVRHTKHNHRGFVSDGYSWYACPYVLSKLAYAVGGVGIALVNMDLIFSLGYHSVFMPFVPLLVALTLLVFTVRSILNEGYISRFINKHFG
jgi:hypothetical protein